MNETRAINDNTLKSLGFTYQNIVALRDCFDLREGERLQIEVNGDISITSAEKQRGRVQKEVKHHLNSETMSERDIDFWKTLANWYDEYERVKPFEKLVLHTTAQIDLLSPFCGWNALDGMEKLNRLREIGTQKRQRERRFRKEYKRIFAQNYDESRLLSILERFFIMDSQETIEHYLKEFQIDYIPPENRESFIAALLGEIEIRVKDPPHKWELTKEQFDEILQKQTAAHCLNRGIPLPNTYAKDTPSEERKKSLEEKAFVRKIYEIDYQRGVLEAITNYWRTERTILSFFQNAPSYLSDYCAYSDDLQSRMDLGKERRELDIDSETVDSIQLIKESQRFYLDMMCLEPRDFGSITNNRPFFQCGVMHMIADDTDFRWKLGDSSELQ